MRLLLYFGTTIYLVMQREIQLDEIQTPAPTASLQLYA